MDATEPQHIAILLVEDNARHAALIAEEIETELPGAEVVHVEGVESARAATADRTFDLILLDYRLPDGDGLEIIRELKEARRPEPIVFVTTTSRTAIAVEAMKLGAADYVVKEEGYVSIIPFVVRDVLERSRLKREREDLERRLARAEHLASLHKLTGGIAHNLNNPLTTVRTFLELLPSRYEADEEFRTSYYELVLSELNRIRDLIGSMMRAVAIPEGGEDTPWQLGELISEVEGYVRPSLAEKSIRLRLDVREGLPPLPAGREAMKQALIILLDNAIAFSPFGGSVTIGTRLKRTQGRRHLLIEVADEGPGVAPEQRKRIFDPFYSTRPGGIGIGLFVAHCLVRAHGGVLDVGSAAPRGALFTMALPAGTG